MQSDFKNTIKAFLKLLFLALIVGLLAGIIGSAFSYTVSWATNIRNINPSIIYFLPIAGFVIVLIYKLTNMESVGTNNIINSIFTGKGVSIFLLPAIFLGTAITHLFGGSAGREGAALQIGGSLGSNVGTLLKLDEKDERLAILCGMSALFAALFGTPVAATIFALEVISVGIIHYSALVPCMVASLTAVFVTNYFGLKGDTFKIANEILKAPMVLKVIFLAALCALLSIIFCVSLHKSEHFFKEKIKNPYLRIFVGGEIVVLITLLLNTRDYNGAGMNIIEKAIAEGEVSSIAFIAKLVLTCVTLAAGFRGGEVVPSLFIGSTFGCLIGPYLGIDPSFAAAIGMISLFCGATNTPLASLALSIEFFGSGNIAYFAIACFVSYMLSGKYSLYHSQKIVYSKLRPEFINASTN